MKPEPPRRPDSDLKRFVKTSIVEYTDLESPVSALGRVVSGNEVSLVSEAAGKIEKGEVPLKKGTSFKKGQLLLVIYKDEVELALKARKSSFLNTFTNLLPDLRIDFPDHYNRFLAFFNAVDFDKGLPELPTVDNEKLKIFLSSRNVLSEYYSIRQDEKKLGRHSLYAPFNGTFTQVNFEAGAFVNTGAQIANMIGTDLLEIEAPVENIHSKWIKIGDKVKIYSQDRTIMMVGNVVRKADFVDMDTQSRSIFVRVTKSLENELLAGEYKLVEFPGQIIPQVMEMPRSAVFNSNEVFIVNDGKLKKEEIDVVKVNETSLIFKGLPEGAYLVVEPLINVQENSPVDIFGEGQPTGKGENGSKQAKAEMRR
jgi:hypothetical protein